MSLYISNGITPTKEKHPLVLLHAFPLSSEMWSGELAKAKEAGIPAVAINVPGFGGRFRMPGWRLATFAHDIKKIIDDLGLVNVVLGGISMGGYAALAFYNSYPESVAGLFLADTRAGADSEEAKSGRKEFARAVREHGSGEASKRMFPKLIGEHSKKNLPELVRTIHRWIAEADPEAIADALEALAERDDSTPVLGTISVPTLILCGEHDEITPMPESEMMAGKISHSTLVRLSGVGHLSSLESPENFWNALDEFLRTIPGKGQ